jgi:hypothetical protein
MHALAGGQAVDVRSLTVLKYLHVASVSKKLALRKSGGIAEGLQMIKTGRSSALK